MLTVTPDPEWQRQAACLGMDPDLFFPPPGDPAVRAKAACARCPVRDECLEAGWREPAGIFGGMSAKERRRIRRREADRRYREAQRA